MSLLVTLILAVVKAKVTTGATSVMFTQTTPDHDHGFFFEKKKKTTSVEQHARVAKDWQRKALVDHKMWNLK